MTVTRKPLDKLQNAFFGKISKSEWVKGASPHHTEFFDIPLLTKGKNDKPSPLVRKVKYEEIKIWAIIHDEMVERLMLKIENKNKR